MADILQWINARIHGVYSKDAVIGGFSGTNSTPARLVGSRYVVIATARDDD